MFVEISTERREVLVQLSVDHEGPVAGQQMRNRRHWQLARLIGVAKQQLSGRERRPASVRHQFALPGLRTPLHPEVVRIAKAISESEVFASVRLAIDDRGGGVLRCEPGCATCL